MDVALVAALALARAERLTGREIAEQAWYLEAVEAKIPGGKQDQYAAALGGFQRLTFRDPDVGVEPITLDPAFAAALERRTVLCYTGRSRVSGDTIARVMAAYERGEPRVTGALRAMKDLAATMAEALRAGGSMFFITGDDSAPAVAAARAAGATVLPVQWSAEGVRAW